MADPGFPRGGGANPKVGGAPTYYLAIFFRKLHENEEILGGGGRNQEWLKVCSQNHNKPWYKKAYSLIPME